MKPVYSDLFYNKDIHTAGIWKMDITPREWLLEDPIIDFATGRVLQAVVLKPNRFWLHVQLTDPSYNFEEILKNSKSGDYYDVSVSGLLNTFNYSLQQVLETIRYSQVVAIITDRNKRRKLVGDTNNGMSVKITHTHKNSPAGLEQLQIDLAAQCDPMAPFYNPDNTPDILGNFLIDSNGDYLLVD